MEAICLLLLKLDIHWLYGISFGSMTKYRDSKHSWTSDVLLLKWNFNYGSEDGWKFTLLETTKLFRINPINTFSRLTKKPAYQLWYKQCLPNKSLESKLVTVTASYLHLWFSVLEPTSLVHFLLCFGSPTCSSFWKSLVLWQCPCSTCTHYTLPQAPYSHWSSCKFTPL